MTSILFVGDLNPLCRSEQRLRVLQDLGHDVAVVSSVPVDPADPDGRAPGVWDRVRHRLGVPADRAGLNRGVIGLLASRRFDVLWVEKALCLRPATLRTARMLQPRLKLAFNSEDDMALRHNQSAWFRGCLPLYDIVFTPKRRNVGELPALGARRTVFLFQTFDRALHRPVEVDADTSARFGAAVGFVGTFEEPRARALLALARCGIDVRVWGNGWRHWANRDVRLRVEGRPVYGEDFVRCLAATRINLGFLRHANRDEHTCRSLEIPACGAFLLAERTGEHAELFEEGREAEFFASQDELLAKVRRYLGDEPARRAIAAAGRARCLNGDYSHHAALRSMLLQLEALEPPHAAARKDVAA